MSRLLLTLTLAFVSAIVGESAVNVAGLRDASLRLVDGFRPPAVPLIVFSPEHSIWSTSNSLNSDVTRFWSTDQVIAMVAAIRVDGVSYRLMGDGSANYGIATAQVAQQTAVRVFPTTTQYEFLLPTVNIAVTLEFFTPAFPDDIATLALPITYVTFKVDLSQATGSSHRVAVYFDVMGNHAVNSESEYIVWADQSKSGSSGSQVLLGLGSYAQNYFSVVGDAVRMSWGHVYLAAADPLNQISHTIASANQSRMAFIHQNPLPPLDVRQPRAANDDSAAMSLVIDFGDVRTGQMVEQTVVYAYDDVQSMLFFGEPYQPYWRRIFGDDLNAFITFALISYPQLRNRGDLYDSDLLGQLSTAAGDNYATVGALAFRQTTGALKIVYDNTLSKMDQVPIVFMKEISSDGDVSTVDVIYPSSPFFVLLGPEVLRLSLLPVLQYANNETNIKYNLQWAPHHLGTWPVCDITPDQQENMPMEETANFMLMLAAIAQKQAHKVDYLVKYRPLLDSWAEYLSGALPDPEDQLCTDDFEGPSPHNVNLAAKGIVGLAAYSLIVADLGDSGAAQKWMSAAQGFAIDWMNMAKDGGNGSVLFHYRLQYDLANTWSIKYNLLFQKILHLDLFPQDVINNETLYYNSQAQKFGVPLDDRAIFTKTDWLSWAAAMAFDAQPKLAVSFLDSIFNFANNTPSRVPFSDWYDTSNANQQGFQARPVIGGIFAHLLLRNNA